MGTTDTTPVILELLRAAAKAHGVHEEQDLGGVYDEQWPEWYAAHITAQLDERGLRLVQVTDLADGGGQGVL
ncbi:hypothetical protein [Microbacterium azadirachtae]|uniref:Uncharacterized protein n=1 Tax=Microbacterium azadirachtae TaxID=582680 RepID=A0A0F0LEM2_9MICO|nr:hypothetical protein [Microbacterium azadirachtae]KJL30715.1 hypothetical protein RS86_03657 [Microbacterium azadirachtae]